MHAHQITLPTAPTDWNNPNWQNARKVHDWKNYTTEHIRLIWDSLTTDQKIIFSSAFQEIADNENWDLL
jgi:hypothetical protein